MVNYGLDRDFTEKEEIKSEKASQDGDLKGKEVESVEEKVEVDKVELEEVKKEPEFETPPQKKEDHKVFDYSETPKLGSEVKIELELEKEEKESEKTRNSG